jgi:hypothetical protein
MIISVNDIPDKIDDSILLQSIFTTGVNELKFWNEALKRDIKLFERIFQFIFSEDHRLAWRSGWIIDNASEQFPELLSGRLPEIISALLTTKDASLKRHFTRILCRSEIPEEFQGATVNRCFELLVPVEPAAVRVNSMQLLFNLTQQLPDLQGELILVIENLIEEGGSAGFMNRAEKLLRKLRA